MAWQQTTIAYNFSFKELVEILAALETARQEIPEGQEDNACYQISLSVSNTPGDEGDFYKLEFVDMEGDKIRTWDSDSS